MSDRDCRYCSPASDHCCCVRASSKLNIAVIIMSDHNCRYYSSPASGQSSSVVKMSNQLNMAVIICATLVLLAIIAFMSKKVINYV